MSPVILEAVAEGSDPCVEGATSIADLFLAANRELALSDARIYRSVGRHLSRTRDILQRAEADLARPQPPLLADPDRVLQGPPSYERQTRKSLESLCRDHGIRGVSRMTKEVMVSRLKALGVEPPPTPVQALSKSELISLLKEVVSQNWHDR